MKLKTQLLLATSLTVLVILGVSEWLNYRHVAAFVNGHEAVMKEGGEHGSMIAALEQGRRAFFGNLLLLHLSHAFLTVVGLVGVLHLLWWRLFLRPLDGIVEQVRIMGLGTWTNPIPIERSDELGDLIKAFNALGSQLVASAEQISLTSRLSALALLGDRIVRRTADVGDHVRAIELILTAARQDGSAIPESALSNLSVVRSDLERIKDEFEGTFAREFDALAVARPKPTRNGDLRVPAASIAAGVDSAGVPRQKMHASGRSRMQDR